LLGMVGRWWDVDWGEGSSASMASFVTP
jgi:hypothetical protein